MWNLSEDTLPVPSNCPRCGEPVSPQQAACPACGHALTAPDPSPTHGLRRRPQVWPLANQGSHTLPPRSPVILQFLPSGTCVILQLEHPVILGRQANEEHVIDLTAFNATQHGVSRRHCRLQRQDQHLTLTDLDSTNGTLVNGEAVLPHHEVTLANGDRLTLGTLHVLVTFG